MQIKNLFSRTIPPNSNHFERVEYFFQDENNIYFGDETVLDLESFSKFNNKIYHIPTFTIDPEGSLLIIFSLIQNDIISALIFQLDRQGKLQQLNSLPSNLSIEKKTEENLAIKTITFLNLFPSKILKDIPLGILENIRKLILKFEYKINISFILELKSLSYLSIVTKLPQVDILILSDFDYSVLLEYAQNDLYIKQVINRDDFFVHYISKHFNQDILRDKPKDISFKEYYFYLLKIINPILNIPLLNEAIEKNQLEIYRYITSCFQYEDSYRNHLINLIDNDEVSELIEKICQTKNIEFLQYFVEYTKDDIKYSQYSIISDVIQTGDIDFYQIALQYYNDEKSELQYRSALRSGNMTMVNLIRDKYFLNETEIMQEIIDENIIDLFPYLTWDVLQYLFEKNDFVSYEYMTNLDLAHISLIIMNLNHKDPDIFKMIEYFLIQIFGEQYSTNNYENVLELMLFTILDYSSRQGNYEIFKYYFEKYRKYGTKNLFTFVTATGIKLIERWFANSVAYGHFDIVMYFEQDLKMLPEYIKTNAINDYHGLRLDIISGQPEDQISTLLLAMNGDNLEMFDYLKYKFYVMKIGENNSKTFNEDEFFNIKNNSNYYSMLIGGNSKILDRYILSPGLLTINLKTDSEDLLKKSDDGEEKQYLANILQQIPFTTQTITKAEYLLIMYLLQTKDYYDPVFEYMICNYDIFLNSNSFFNIYSIFGMKDDYILIELIKQEYLFFEQFYHAWKVGLIESITMRNILDETSKRRQFAKDMFEIIFKNLDDDFYTQMRVEYRNYNLSLQDLLDSLLLLVFQIEFDILHFLGLEAIITKFITKDIYSEVSSFVSAFDEKVNTLPNRYKLIHNFKVILLKIFLNIQEENRIKFLESCLTNKNYRLLKLYLRQQYVNNLLTQAINADSLVLFIYLINEFPFTIEEDTLKYAIDNSSIKIIDYCIFTLNLEYEPSMLKTNMYGDQEEVMKAKVIPYLISKGLPIE